MQKFILFFRGSDVYQPDQSPEALQALTVRMMDWVGRLSADGRHLASERLERRGSQVSGQKKQVTNAPFGEIHDIIGGCTIVLAQDLGEALEIAKACPILETNATIEVRPIQSI